MEISDVKRKQILELIAQTEFDLQVKILLAVESGSRAWGFASKDSDYDVRFIYMRPKSWYLSAFVERKRNVIELPITDDLDINGWDLRKAVQLMSKSNPALLEWLHSPIVYCEHEDFKQWFLPLLSHYYNPRASYWHYFKMAKGNFREYLQGDKVKTKKYFYVLRPVLCMNWIAKYETLPPIEFDKLVAHTVTDDALNAAIADLLLRKKAGLETDYDRPTPAISEFLQLELLRLAELAESVRHCKPDNALADKGFMDYLSTAQLEPAA